MQKAIGFNDVANVFVKEYHFWCINNDKVINILNDTNLSIKTGTL